MTKIPATTTPTAASGRISLLRKQVGAKNFLRVNTNFGLQSTNRRQLGTPCGLPSGSDGVSRNLRCPSYGKRVHKLAMPLFKHQERPEQHVVVRLSRHVFVQQPANKSRFEVVPVLGLAIQQYVLSVRTQFATEHGSERNRKSHLGTAK